MVSLESSASPTKVNELELWTPPAYAPHGDAYWDPTMSFATDGEMVAVGGVTHDRESPRRIVVASIDDAGNVARWNVRDFSGHVELHNGDLYAALGREIRQYPLKPDGELEYQTLIAPSVAQLLEWGDSLVAVIKLETPTANGRIGAVYEVQSPPSRSASDTGADPDQLSLRYLADFDWVDFMGAKAWGAHLVIYPRAGEGVVVMERGLPELAYLPSVQ